jgi:hypothetical protein
MVCPDCLYDVCIATDCKKAIAAFNEVSKAYPNLKGIWNKKSQGAGNTVSSTNCASSPNGLGEHCP